MADDVKAALRRQLNISADVLDELPETEATKLLAMFHDARRLQDQEITVAQQEALNHVPKLMRTPVRKILWG